MANKCYTFTVTLTGYGKNPDEAWRDACEGFEGDWGSTPGEYEVEEGQ